MVRLPYFGDPLRPSLRTDLFNQRQRLRELFFARQHELLRDDIINLAEEMANARLTEPLPEAFDILLHSLRNDVQLSFLGRVQSKWRLARLVANRICIAALLREHPEIREQRIVKPLFVVGFPRTGTTLLHRLLSLYEGARVPLFWELLSPAPPATPETYNSDVRIEQLRRGMQDGNKFYASMKKIHHIDPLDPEECLYLFENAFCSPSFRLNGELKSYSEWLFNTDLRPAYEYYRLQLQILQWGVPGNPWILKSPTHTRSLGTLLDVFPDACIVQTHRAPEKFLPSVCSLKGTFQRIVTHGVRRKQLGEIELKYFSDVVDRVLDVRRRYGDASFFDVRYQDLTRDPQKCVGDILEHFGYPRDADLPKKMSDYLADNRQHKFGAHKYSLRQFGLDQQQLDTAFGEYRTRFLDS